MAYMSYRPFQRSFVTLHDCTSGHKWLQVATSGYKWLQVVVMWLKVVKSWFMWLSGFMWLKVTKCG